MQAKVKLTLHFAHTHTNTHALSIVHFVTHTLRIQTWLQSSVLCVWVCACICIGMMTRPHCLSFIEPSSTKHNRIELLLGTKPKRNEMKWNVGGVVCVCVCVGKSQSGCAFIMYPVFDCRHVWAYTIGI